MSTGFVWHELYMWHDTGSHADMIPAGNPVQPSQHIESPESKRRFRNLLEVSGLYEKLTQIKPREATEEELLRAHGKEYIRKIKGMSDENGGDAGFFVPFGPGSYEIARLAAGGVIEAVDAVIEGQVNNAYALVRPPGHHAEPDLGKGFCIFANASIAGKYALEVKGLDRIAFVDWDAHHGNGTEKIFWSDPGALTISIHQDRCFPPDSGMMQDNGAGEGKGYNVNIPLPPGSGNGAYVATFDRIVMPLLEKFKPQLIIVPCGFDASVLDPLSRMMMHGETYRNLTQKLMEFADSFCDGRLVMCHEGGYNTSTTPFYGLAVMEALSRTSTGVVDPFQQIAEGTGGQELQAHQDEIIKQAEELITNLK